MSELSDLDVSNVFLYVADAVRWDALPESVEKRGRTFKTVAASIHTPTSFSSIVSGLHPPQHGVEQFGDALGRDAATLFSLRGVRSVFANTINERFNDNPESQSVLNDTLGTTESPPDSLGTVDQPFLFVERGPGGHAPYGDYSGNAWEYFRDQKDASASTLREEYWVGVEHDRDYFESRLQLLEERGLLEDTLVIYTSDHGELLGEEGCLGHNTPIHPKLAYVPTVLMNPSVGEATITDGVMRHVDILPTVAALFDRDVSEAAGRDLTDEPLATCGACFYTKSVSSGLPGPDPELSYESTWDAGGGYVHPLTGRLNRFTVLLGTLLKSAKREHMRRHIRSSLPFYLSETRQYGEPSFSERDSKSYLRELSDMHREAGGSSSLGDGAEQRLRELGYLN